MPRTDRRWNLRLAAGAAIVLVPVLASLLARLAVGRADTDLLAFEPSSSPSTAHLLGTDGSGRDVLATLVYSTAPTFELALLAGLAATLVGTAAGLASGYMGGAVDTVVRGCTDVMVAVPAFALLILVAAIMGGLSLSGLALVIALVSWPQVARTIRAQVVLLRDQPFVRLSRLANRGSPGIMVFELLPNMLALVAAMFVTAASGALALAIGLELIGLGPDGAQTLGLVLHDALSRGALSLGLWWWWLAPTTVLILFFVGLFLISLAVDELSNPRLRQHG
jgi:peptide/nickel transport system permease protein